MTYFYRTAIIKNTPQSQLRCARSPNLGEQLLMGVDVLSTNRFRPDGLKEKGDIGDC